MSLWVALGRADDAADHRFQRATKPDRSGPGAEKAAGQTGRVSRYDAFRRRIHARYAALRPRPPPRILEYGIAPNSAGARKIVDSFMQT